MPKTIEKINTVEHLDLINHFTASALVIVGDRVLLVHHKRIGAWLPPGGHLYPNEMPHEAAIREVLEETGVMIEIISEPVPQTESLEHLFLPQPLCIQAVKAVEGEQSLYHLDIVFLARPAHLGSELNPNYSELHGAQWFNLDHLKQIPLANNVSELIALARSKMITNDR